MAAEVLRAPHPLYIRLYGTFAAPLFIFLSGMMIPLTKTEKAYGFSHYLYRCLLLFLTAASIDVMIWKIYPFIGVGVLYLIGISLPLSWFFNYLPSLSKWTTVIIVFCITPLLQEIMGYSFLPAALFLDGTWSYQANAAPRIISQWIIDGWFPLLPWVGFSFLGVLIGEMRYKAGTYKSLATFRILIAGISVMASGIVIWFHYPGLLLVRIGYSEMFYPPVTGYILTSVGIILLLFYVVDRRPNLPVYYFLRFLGESSLAIYVIHILIIELFIVRHWYQKSFLVFVFIYFLLVLFLVLLGIIFDFIRKRWKTRPYLIRFFIG